MNDLLLLYSNCQLAKGARQSLICDLQKNLLYRIPNSFFELFEDNRLLDVRKIKQKISNHDNETLNDYIAFLIEHELAFYVKNKSDYKRFPNISIEWDYPAQISNVIIDYSDEISSFFFKIISNCTLLGCRHAQVRFFSLPSIESINIIAAIVDSSNFIAVDFIIDTSSSQLCNDTIIDFKLLIQENKKINSIIFSGSEKDCIIFNEGDVGVGNIIAVSESINSHLQCGNIHPSYFSINIETFTEAQHHNTCLNRKISIDVNGNIKNCPSMPASFGNIKDTTLQEAMENSSFKKYWNINKDKIHVCKDCEFRYVCTDCRAYIEDPEDIYSKPLKCGYNPYTGEWSEWSTNPLKQKAIDHYGLREIV